MSTTMDRGSRRPQATIPSLLDGGAGAGGWETPPTSWQRLRRDPLFVRARQVFGPAAAVLALQFVAFPMPPGVYAYGVVLGALGALVAVGMALTWRSNRIVNFAQGQLGVVPAVLAVSLLLFRGVSLPVAFAAGLAAAVVLGAAVDLVAIRRFSRSSRLVLTVATIGLSQLLSAAALGVPALWGRTAVDVTTGVLDLPLAWSFTVEPVVLTDDHLVAVVVALAGLVGTSVFLRRAPAGVAVRAAAERAERAGLLGIPVARLEALVWVLATVLSFLGVFFRTAVVGLPLSNPFVGFGTALGAVAALMLGRMDDLPAVTASAVALGILEQAVTWNHGDTPELVYPVYAVVVILALATRRVDELRGGQGDVSSWQAADTVREVPRRLRGLPEVRLARVALAVATVGAAALLPAVVGPGDELKAAVVVVWAIVGLSVVVLTGWAGQVSLGQMAFAGYGAGFGAVAFLDLGWDAMLVLPVAGLVGAAIAVVVGLPALRLRGVFLAAITLAFSVGSSSYLLSQRHTSWIPRGRIESVQFFGVAIDTPRDTYWLALGIACLLFAAVAGIRRSRTGRVLLALRENELAARSHGISVTRAKLTGFALSGALASVAGCLYVIAVFGYSESLFTPTDSFVAFTSTVVGGAGSLVGAVAGALFARGGTWLLSGTWAYVPSAVGVIVVLWVLPGGLAGLLYRLRDRALRVVAARRGLHVPVLAGPEAGSAPPPAPRAAGPWRSAPARVSAQVSATRSVGPAPAPVPAPSAAPWGMAGSRLARAARGPAVLACRGLDVAYGDVQVLYDVSLDVHAGEVVALLGTNGAGKSTLLRAVSGVLAPSAGTIELDGRAIAGDAAHAVAARGVVQMPGGHGVFPGLTVDENLRMACWLERRSSRRARRGIRPAGEPSTTSSTASSTANGRRPDAGIVVPDRDAPLDTRIDAVLATFPVLSARLGARAGDLSGGQQQMLSLGMALLARPRVLLVDELSLGLAPAVVARLLDVVRAVAAQGTAVVLVEQSVDVALRVADRAAFMEKGRVRFDGPAADLAGRPDLLRSVFLEGATAGLAPHAAPGAVAGPGPDGLDGSVPAGPVTSVLTVPTPDGSVPAEPGGPTLAVPTPGALAALPASPVVAPLFEMRGITVSFGGIRAVDDVTVTVEPGEIVGFIGPNGAGKTTLLDVASGVTPAERGLVLLDGVDVAGAPADERSRRGMARSFQDARLYPGLSVEQVLAVALDRWVPVTDPFRAAARTPAERAAQADVTRRTDELLDLLGLDRYRDALTSELSTGTRRIVEVACVLAHHPTLVLLDEPSSGIAQRESEALGPLLRKVRDVLGCSMLVVEHDMALLSGLADRLVALDQGRVVASGRPADVLRDPRVVSAYLGGPGVEGAAEGGTAATPAVPPSPAGALSRPEPPPPPAPSSPTPPPPTSPGPTGPTGPRGPAGRGPGRGPGRRRGPHVPTRVRTFALPILTAVAVLAYAVAGGLGRAPSDAEVARPTPAERLGLGEVGSHADAVPLTWQRADGGQRAGTPWVANCDAATGRIAIPSVYAPPCVPAYDAAAGNGGATWGGVTPDTIRVALYQGGAGDIRTALTRTLDTDEQVDETTDRFTDMLNDVSETYGRRVELVRFQASGGMDDEVAARADAIRLADEVAPFAVIGGPPLTTVFAEELAVRGIICVDCGLATPDSFHQQNAPFIWGPLPTPEEFLTILGDYLFSRVMGDPARFAGDPELRDDERVLGVVRFEQRIPVFSDLQRLVLMVSEANGVTPAANEVYTFDLDKMPERATTIIARMKDAGVTTVLFLGDPIMPIYLTQAATAQGYFPEWLVSGTVLTDSTVMGRQYDQRQWAHAFGLSVLPAKTPVEDLEAYRLHRWYFGEPPAAAGTAQLAYQDLMLLFLGIHLAGPDLRPETFRDGLFGYPAAGGGPTTPRISFGDNDLFIAEDLGTRIDYLAADDMTEVWWDAEAVGPDEVGNEGRGMWRYANGGERYLPNEMPERDTDAFRDEGSVLLYDDLPPEDRPPEYPAPRR